MERNEAPRISLRSLGSLFCDTWKLYKERWQVLVEIILLPVLVTILGYVLVGLGSPFSILGGVITLIGWILFIFSVLPVIFSIHNTAGVDASYRATIGWFWPFVWVVILELLAVLGGSIMLIIPGIWLACALSFTAYVFVIEHRRGIDALRQSKDYIKGYWWAVAGRVILLGLIFLAATVIIEIPVTVLAGNAMRILVTMVMTLFFVPFSAIYSYTIFGNLRELKPDLAEVQMKKGTAFIKASAIVGIVVPVLLVLILVFLVWMGAIHDLGHADRYGPQPGYVMPLTPQQ
jgi:hypothetical protein